MLPCVTRRATSRDAYSIANAAWRAGATLVRDGHPNDALKLFTLGQFHLSGFQPGRSAPATLRAEDPRVPTLTTRLSRSSATAYAVMGGPDQATRCLAEAHDGWAPQDALERAGGDFATAGIQLELGRLDAAEQHAASAVRAYGEGDRLGRAQAKLLLAEVNVRAREPRRLPLARHAVDEVSALQSVAVRRPAATAAGRRAGSPAQQ